MRGDTRQGVPAVLEDMSVDLTALKLARLMWRGGEGRGGEGRGDTRRGVPALKLARWVGGGEGRGGHGRGAKGRGGEERWGQLGGGKGGDGKWGQLGGGKGGEGRWGQVGGLHSPVPSFPFPPVSGL